MIRIKERKTWFALLALLLLLAGCKGETPTAPPPGGGVPPGGTTPPTGASLVLTTSNATPFVDNTVTITATVTENGQPAPNGTAVEFTTNNGTFTDVTPAVQALIRTTLNGVAVVHLTSSTPVVARVTATVNNITRFIDVSFQIIAPCTPPNPLCPVVPTITSISPPRGRPEGGQIIRITGTNFIAPVRVLFDLGQPSPTEALIVSSTETTIDVLTPAINLGAAQQLLADVTVITRAGQSNEQRVTSVDGFTFENVALTPIIYSLSPTSGPINGNTRVTIFGEGFQAPLQVFFGSAEAQVVEVQFGQIIVMSPDARSTNPNGSGTVTGPVSVSVVNIRSNTRGTSPQQFRYVAKMQITAISPLFGSSVGGTDVTIDGVGFDAPVQVIIGTSPAVEAQVIRVSGTQILIRTPSLPSACAGGTGNITVTNVENGDSASSGSLFTFIPVAPQILSTNSPVVAGSTLTASVQNPGVGALGSATIRFGLGTLTLIPSPSTITSGTTTQLFSIAVPLTGFSFPSVACTTGGGAPGTQPGPIDVPLQFRNVTTGCTDTVTVRIEPLNPVCVQAPPQASVTSPATGCATMVAPFPGSGSTSITFRNNASAGSQSLTVTPSAPTGPNAGDFSTPTPASQSIAPGSTASFSVTFTPSAAGSRTANVAFTTNDPTQPTISVCLTGNQPPP